MLGSRLLLLLALLSLCKSQWTLQNEYGSNGTSSTSLDQPGLPEDDWVENIPRRDLPDIVYGNVPHTTRVSHDSIGKSSEIDNQNIEPFSKAVKFSTDSGMSADAENTERKGKSLLLSPKFPIASVFSKLAGNVTLSSRSSVKDSVTNLVNNGRALRNDTDQLVEQINLFYLNLAVNELDNDVSDENSYKYGMSLILRFLFEFYRIFRKLSSQTTQTNFRVTSVDVYGVSYDKAVAVMKEKRSYSPLELSAPLRRSADIFKSILYESVVLIQTECSAIDPNWKCIVVYIASLIKETLNCSNVWYHAFIHMIALEKFGIQDNFIYKVASLEKFKELAYFENIFDFVLEKIQEYREVGRFQLSAEAIFFTMLADLQENGLLDCISIDYLYN